MADQITGKKEKKIPHFDSRILRLLLADKTTKKNIIWATRDYEELGPEYYAKYPITLDLITGKNADVLQPRIFKEKHRQETRKRDKAEVFTPAWICNRQNNLIDSAWFGRENVFNTADGDGWETVREKICFGDTRGRRWQDYVDAKRLEITCGEAPYLTSRYDMASGSYIETADRIGLLDRKLRIVGENTETPEEWTKWAVRALESIYGFEYQGDSLLIARENILCTFIEFMSDKFQCPPGDDCLRRAANVIAWNIWQMDGLTCTVPYGTIEEPYTQLSLEDSGDLGETRVYCKIHDWRSKETLLFRSIAEGKAGMI